MTGAGLISGAQKGHTHVLIALSKCLYKFHFIWNYDGGISNRTTYTFITEYYYVYTYTSMNGKARKYGAALCCERPPLNAFGAMVGVVICDITAEHPLETKDAHPICTITLGRVSRL